MKTIDDTMLNDWQKQTAPDGNAMHCHHRRIPQVIFSVS